MKGSKYVRTILKIGITAIALTLVINRLDFQHVLGIVSKIKWAWALLAVLTFICSKFIAATRLNAHFRIRKLSLSPALNLKLYALGMFYNLFLPGGIGGDGYKVFWLNRQYQTPVRTVIGALLWDRLIGLTVLVFYAMITILLSIKLATSIQLTLLTGLFLTLPVYYFAQRFLVPDLLPILFKATSYSLVSQGFILICVWFLLLSLGIEEQTLPYLSLFMVAVIIANVPISLGGLGPRELVSMLGAGYLALNPDTAVVLSLLFYLITLLVSIPGIYFSFYPKAISS